MFECVCGKDGGFLFLFVCWFLYWYCHSHTIAVYSDQEVYVCMYVCIGVSVSVGWTGWGGEAEVRGGGGVIDKVQDLLEMSRSRR